VQACAFQLQENMFENIVIRHIQVTVHVGLQHVAALLVKTSHVSLWHNDHTHLYGTVICLHTEVRPSWHPWSDVRYSVSTNAVMTLSFPDVATAVLKKANNHVSLYLIIFSRLQNSKSCVINCLLVVLLLHFAGIEVNVVMSHDDRANRI